MTSEITFIREDIAITDRSSGTDYAGLRDRGFDAVLCLDRAEFPFDADPDSLPLPVWLRHLPPGAPGDEEFEAAVSALKLLVQTSSKVVVHCHHGQGRSVAVVAAYLSDSERLSPDEALSFVASKRGTLSEVPTSLRMRVLKRRPPA